MRSGLREKDYERGSRRRWDPGSERGCSPTRPSRRWGKIYCPSSPLYRVPRVFWNNPERDLARENTGRRVGFSDDDANRSSLRRSFFFFPRGYFSGAGECFRRCVKTSACVFALPGRRNDARSEPSLDGSSIESPSRSSFDLGKALPSFLAARNAIFRARIFVSHDRGNIRIPVCAFLSCSETMDRSRPVTPEIVTRVSKSDGIS